MSSIHGVDIVSGLSTPIRATQDAAHVYEAAVLAGEEIPASVHGSVLRVVQACNLSIISKTAAVIIGGGNANDTRLMGILITAALTGTCVINGFADSDGTAQTITLPVGTVGFINFLGAINSAGALSITCANAADDNLVSILWRVAV